MIRKLIVNSPLLCALVVHLRIYKLWVRQLLSMFLKVMRAELQLVRITGYLVGSKQEASLLVLAQESVVDAYHSFFFARNAIKLDRLGRRRVFRIRRLLRLSSTSQDDILLAEAWPWQTTSSSDWLALEAWSQAIVDLPSDRLADDSALKAYLSGLVSSTIQRRLKSYWRSPCDTAQSSADQPSLEHYYYQYYLPLVEARHGDNAHTMSLQTMQDLGGASVEKILLYLHDEQRPVAGMLLLFDHVASRLLVQEYGVRPDKIDDDKEFQRLYTAMNYEALAFAWYRGIKQVSFGGGQNQLRSGVYYYKKQWGCRFERDRKRESVLLHWNSKNAHEILKFTPLLYFKGSQAFGLCSLALNEALETGELAKTLVSETNKLTFAQMRELTILLSTAAHARLDDLQKAGHLVAKVPIRLSEEE